jgi:predicted anti-sigma-YlaC factor YlaD
MHCDEFIQSFSDFLDAEYEKHPLQEYNQHLESCADCRGYDRVMRCGLRLVKELDGPEPMISCRACRGAFSPIAIALTRLASMSKWRASPG